MEPVSIKLYGMFPTSKKRYVIQVVLACVLMALLLGMWLFYWSGIRDKFAQLGDDAPPQLRLVVAFCDSIPYVVLVFALLQTVEAYFVMRAFARKQATVGESMPPATGSPGVEEGKKMPL